MTELSWFFVVGAQKAGTTTFHDWLCKSGEVALPWSKETHFFSDEKNFSKGTKWYMKQFRVRGETRVLGEIDPEYMYFPECAERIKSFADAPKLIFILRDPLSRAYSNYLMSVRSGYEMLTFSDALCAEEGRMRSGGRFSQIHHGYMARGLYAIQIERMLRVFPKSETMVMLFEDLFSSQEAATESLRQVCEFIGIDNEKLSVDLGVRKNQAAEPRYVFIRDFISGQAKLKKYVGKLVPSRNMKIRIMKFLDNLNMKPITRSISEKYDVPSFVYKIFIDDLGKLQRFIDVDVSQWISEYEKRLAI